MRILVRDLTPGQDYLMQFRTNDGTNVSAWSPVYRIRTEGDVTPPMPPTNLTWEPTGESFVASWDAPTLDGPDAGGVNKALKDFKDFEVTVQNEAGNLSKVYYTADTHFELTLPMNAQAFGGIELTVKITVKSRDLTGNKSAGVSKTAVEDTPPIPSAPVISNTMGQIAVEWDGNTSLGTINPFNLNYVEIHASTTNNFTPSTTTLVGRFEGWVGGKQRTIVPGLTYDVVNYFKLISVNKKGKKSPPSPQASGTPTRLTGLDIAADGQIGAGQINFTARQIGGANAFYGTVLPTGSAAPDGTVYKTGDVFYNTAIPPVANAGKTYRRTATAWVEDTTIGVIAGTKIIANTLTSNAVGTNLLITSKANIGNAVIDDANIANLKAGKIVADDLATNTIISNSAQIKDAIILSAKIISLSANKITTGSLSATEKIIAGPAAGDHAEMSGTGFRVFASDPVDGVPNEVVRMGTTNADGSGTSDFFGVVDATGALLASIDDTGGINGQNLNIVGDPVFRGTALSSAMTAIPGSGNPGGMGPVMAQNYYGFASAQEGNIKTEYGLIEMSVNVAANRMYWVVPEVSYVKSDQASELALRVRGEYGGGVSPTINSGQIYLRRFSHGWVNYDQTASSPGLWQPSATGTWRLLLTAECPSSAAGVIHITSGNGGAVPTLNLIDLGPAKSSLAQVNRGGGVTYQAPAPPAPPPPPPTRQYYVDLGPAGRRSWRGDGSEMVGYGNDVYQGYQSTNGNTRGHFWFDLPDITGVVDRVDVYMYFRHWWFNSGGRVLMNITDQGGIFTDHGFRGVWEPNVTVPKPGSMTVTVPPDWFPQFRGVGNAPYNGRASTIKIGPGPGTNQTYYGVATDCRLRIWYTQ